MSRKNSTILVLMISSIALLIILQFLWLRSAYRDASNDFRKESGDLFRSTIIALRDTMIQRSITHIDGDSIAGLRTVKRYSFHGKPPEGTPPDSLMTFQAFEQMDARVEVIVQSSNDSIKEILDPLMRRIHRQKTPARFFIRLDADSLKKDSIRYFYQNRLKESDINVPFIVYGKSDTTTTVVTGSRPQVFSGWVPANPAFEYAVGFPEVKSFLLARITPQIAFSVFLTLITLVAFYVLYRSLISQQRLMELKNDFISNVTHELKTPVATVSVAIEALRNFNAMEDKKKTAEYLEIAKNELDRLTLMTDKILKTTVFEHQGILMENEKVDMDSVVAHVLASLRLLMVNRRIVQTFVKEGDSFLVTGSRTHLTNVLYNLIDNALKYSKDGSRISLTLKRENEHVILSVKDEGIGIPEEYRERIFEKFFRVPTGDVHNVKGYGLGLSYVKSVVSSHSGNIAVESTVGSGSTFVINLPAATA
jgi:two-component system phosphate regulon sensor histidine kinase PhoR